MVNFNGNIQQESAIAVENNRGFLFGDSVFETIKVLNNQVLFLEDHYFRLMASMRICRMEIPMNFTMEYFESQILDLVQAQTGASAYRIRFSVYRDAEGFYLPKSRKVQFIVTAAPLESEVYTTGKEQYEVELYKDFYITKQLLSSLKTNNKMLQITGSIFAEENGYDNCLVLNDDKNVVEALQSNLFMKMGNVVVTPPISEGCLNGIMRKQVLELLKKIDGLEVKEAVISPFDLQKADELFLTNVISGVQPITKYRKKEYTSALAHEVVKRLNAKIRLS